MHDSVTQPPAPNEATNMLCHVCQEITLEKLASAKYPNYYVLYDTYYELAQSAASCDLCRLIHSTCETDVRWDSDWVLLAREKGHDSVVSLHMSRWCDDETSASYPNAKLEVRMAVTQPTGGCAYFYAKIDLYTHSGLIDCRAIASHAADKVVFDLALTWLEDCRANHASCVRQVSKVPTRVLDVGSVKPFLYVSPPGAKFEYLALSHCWGGVQTAARTTLATLDDHICGIPMEKLPSTFADAVTITRRLGFRYIWIDSLCIVQDSKADWTAEAAQMGAVYQGAVLTIAARAARNSHDGILKPRPDADTVPVCRLPAGKGSMYFRRTSRDFESVNMFTTEQPLDTRAWVFQERSLAPRTLIYGPQGIVWDCCEVYTSERDATPMWRKAPTDTPMIHTIKRSLGRMSNIGDVHEKWLQVVDSYGQRALSFGSDKLPALSGLASTFERILQPGNDRYVAGLWWNDLRRGLLWSSEYSSLTKRIDNGSPSWSWTAIEGAIVTFYGPILPEAGSYSAEILAAHVSCVDEKYHLGQVRGGTLTVRGLVIDVESWNPSDGGYKKPAVVTRETWKVILYFDVEKVSDNPPTDKRKYIVLQLVTTAQENTAGGSFHGLVLERVPEDTKEVYRRVGSVTGRGKNLCSGWKRRTVKII
ncbi:heterokaryon incompatibility protein-domain-containing protein [Geopyxis carbonaria]|nr:heterokaryon incompatibility protein-domain-containing protein [Geopyxis carbonaria]